MGWGSKVTGQGLVSFPSQGIVRFGKVQTADDVLNDWGRNIDRVLDVVSKITQDISKEAMQRTRGQAVAAAAGTSAA